MQGIQSSPLLKKNFSHLQQIVNYLHVHGLYICGHKLFYGYFEGVRTINKLIGKRLSVKVDFLDKLWNFLLEFCIICVIFGDERTSFPLRKTIFLRVTSPHWPEHLHDVLQVLCFKSH